MKKFLSLLIVSVLAVSVMCTAGCASKESKILGTWELESVDLGGSIITVEEAEAMGDSSLSEIQLVFKEGGKAFAIDHGNADMVDWSVDGDTYNVGVQAFKIVDGKLTMEAANGTMYFKKVSDSQTVQGSED